MIIKTSKTVRVIKNETTNEYTVQIKSCGQFYIGWKDVKKFSATQRAKAMSLYNAIHG